MRFLSGRRSRGGKERVKSQEVGRLIGGARDDKRGKALFSLAGRSQVELADVKGPDLVVAGGMGAFGASVVLGPSSAQIEA